MHLQMGILAQVRNRNESPPLAERQPILGTAIHSRQPFGCDDSRQFVRGRPAPQRRTQVDASGRVESEVPESVGRQTAVVEEMIPKTVPSGSVKRSAGAEDTSATGSMAP